ncbi:MAG: hypothetical protein VXX79_08950, partial [Pseudomonadota bacterium]|nr:hypothetical protein [Pseudomonadota bacterium]
DGDGVLESVVAVDEAGIGELETAQLFDPSNGRGIPQVWHRMHEGVFVPITGGISPTELIDYRRESGIGIVTVKRDGSTKTAKHRVTRIGDDLRTRPRKLRLWLFEGQSLDQGHTDAGDDPVPPWRGNAAERAFMFDSAAVDGIERGPRGLQSAPTAGNVNEVIPDAVFASLKPLRESTHGFDGIRAMTMASPAAFALHGQHLQWEDESIFLVIGTGSTAAADFEPSAGYAAAVGTGSEATELALCSAHFQSAIKAIEAAAARVDAYNAIASGLFELEVWTGVQQGTEDNNSGTLEADYIASWTAVFTALKAKIDNINAGGTAATYAANIFVQNAQIVSGKVGMAGLAQAEMMKTGTIGGVPIYGMPTYHLLPGGNAVHLKPLTYFGQGSTFAYYAAEIMAGNNPTILVNDGDAVLESASSTRLTLTRGSGSFE